MGVKRGWGSLSRRALERRWTSVSPRDAPTAHHRDEGPVLTYSVSRLDSEEKFWASVLWAS